MSLFISATDTNIGKTYVAAQILKSLLDQGNAVTDLAYYKPLQCGTDTDFEWIANQIPDLCVYNSYLLKYPAAPSFAAAQENLEIDINKILRDFQEIKNKHKIVIVEGAGGLAVPVKGTYLVSDLIRDLDLPLLLVLRQSLGTINHSLLSIEHARSKKLNLIGFYANHFAAQNKNPDGILQTGSSLLPHEESSPRMISEISSVPHFKSVTEICEALIHNSQPCTKQTN